MIAHTSIPVRRYSVAKSFYRDVLKTLGYKNNMEYGHSAGFNDGKNTDFWISQKKTVVPTHLAFRARGRKQVEAFHKAALAAGGKDNGKPGYRDYSTPKSRSDPCRPQFVRHSTMCVAAHSPLPARVTRMTSTKGRFQGAL